MAASIKARSSRWWRASRIDDSSSVTAFAASSGNRGRGVGAVAEVLERGARCCPCPARGKSIAPATVIAINVRAMIQALENGFADWCGLAIRMELLLGSDKRLYSRPRQP